MEILLSESAFSPGHVFKNECLIYGDSSGAILNEMVNLNESTVPANSVVKFRGKFQEAEAINKNKRSYPYNVLDSNVKRLEESVKNGALCGELDHPTDSIVHFSSVSHKITKLWWEGKVLMGEGTILNTPCGKILRSLINDGVRVGISSRGVGTGRVDENGILQIAEGYKLITFDAVADPSTHSAFQEKIKGSKNEMAHEHQTPIANLENNTAKNNASGIYKINKELLLACVGGEIKKQTSKLKERLS